MEPAVRWEGDANGALLLLDQTLLPSEHVVLRLNTLAGVEDAIRRLAVRGAPAIGCAAGYGMVVGVRERAPKDDGAFLRDVEAVALSLKATRPTAVNLAWAVDRVQAAARRQPTLANLLIEAVAIHEEDQELCRRMGDAGAALIEEGMTVLTHCNAGALATGGIGTALALMFTSWQSGTRFRVLADETRPLLQGARLTALELHEAGIPVEVIADGAAAGLMARGEIDLVITGADRVAANGDIANKVGTYGVALAAKAHDVPMYVAAPCSTFDLSLPHGSAIPIEDRAAEEVLSVHGARIAPPGVGARNPAFDITPAALLAGLVTDRGLVQPVTADRIKEVVG